jgi:hypothetical protein
MPLILEKNRITDTYHSHKHLTKKLVVIVGVRGELVINLLEWNIEYDMKCNINILI